MRRGNELKKQVLVVVSKTESPYESIWLTVDATATFTEVQLAFRLLQCQPAKYYTAWSHQFQSTDPASVTVASVKKTDAACVLIYRYILPSRQAVTAEITEHATSQQRLRIRLTWRNMLWWQHIWKVMPRAQRRSGQWNWEDNPKRLDTQRSRRSLSSHYQQPVVAVQTEDHGQNTVRHHGSLQFSTRAIHHWLSQWVSSTCHWILHSCSRVRKAVPSPLIVGEQICKNLRKMLMPPKPADQSHMSQTEQEKKSEGCFDLFKCTTLTASCARNIWSKPPPSVGSVRPTRHAPPLRDHLNCSSSKIICLADWAKSVQLNTICTWGQPEIPCRTDLTTTGRTLKSARTVSMAVGPYWLISDTQPNCKQWFTTSFLQ